MDQDVAAKEQPRYIRLNARDNVAIVVNDFGLPAGTRFACGLTLRAFVPQGHKTALIDIAEGAPIIRYGEVIGHALSPILAGEWVDEARIRMPEAPDLDKLEIATARRLVEERNATYRYELVSRRMQAAPGWLGSQMGLTPGTEVLHLEAMHYGDGQPFHFEDRWINIAAVPGCAEADFALEPPGEWLLAEVPFSNADVSFTATAADAALADYLACAPGAALFQMERSTWFQDAPVTFARMTFHPGYRMRSRY